MGSSCSSAQKKKDKERQNSHGGQCPIGGRRRSTESLPYGKGSPPSSRRPSFDPASAQPPLPEQAESPTEPGSGHKKPVDATISSTGTPIVKDAPSFDAIGLPDLQRFPDHIRSLILGRVDEIELFPPLQEITLYVAADFYDSVVERDALIERVFLNLRRYSAEKGYELNVIDLHWGIPGVGLVDHSLPDLCMSSLEKWRTRRRLLTLVIFNDNIGATLLPRTVPKPHFESGMESVESEADKELFNKWYKLDSVASPMVYVLQPVIKYYPGISGEDPTERGNCMKQWKEEAERMITVFGNILPDGQRQKCLTSVFQDEIKFIVNDDPQEAKRVLWTQRRFTHKPTVCAGDKPSPSARKIDQSKVQLEDYLPDTQKMVLYVKWHEEGLDPQNFEEDEQYISDFTDALKEELKKLIDGLLEEDFLEEAREKYRGIEKPLYLELVQQYRACREMNKNFQHRESSLLKVKDYLAGEDNFPLIVQGPSGSGKTSLMAKLTEYASSWFPSACVITRLVGLTAESSTQQQLLRSISEQCCALYGEHPAVASSNVHDWDFGLGKLLSKVSEFRPLIVLIDGIDQLAEYSSKDLQWLPRELPAHVKLILTVRDNSEELEKIKELMENSDCYYILNNFTKEEAKNTINKLLESRKKKLSSSELETIAAYLDGDTSARYTELLGLMTLKWTDMLVEKSDSIQKNTEGLIVQYLTHVESHLGITLLTFVLGLLITAKHGISESEILDILSCQDNLLDLVFLGGEPKVRRIPAVLWASIKYFLQPFLRTQVLGGRTLTMLSCEAYRTVIKTYLLNKGFTIKSSAQILVDYFFGKWAESKAKPIAPNSDKAQDRFVLEQPLAYGTNPNKRKLEELPRLVLLLNDNIRDNFLFDATWLLYKFCGADPYQQLEDLWCYQKTLPESDKQVELLENFVKLSSYALRSDGSQFFAQVYGRLKRIFSNADISSDYPSLKSIFETSCKPPLSSLLPLDFCLEEPIISSSSNNCNSNNHDSSPDSDSPKSKSFPFTGLYTIKEDKAHVVSISSEKNEIVVWNIYEQAAVRRITGINEPKDIKMIDINRALVLCNRELKVYHLDQGTLVVKLKGVMNQKMAYYGLHNENYAVALSRNRMYVNMTNLETGDLETTFKVGEDRFLNSLLVSANGRICVCGDETQKPFPLLVWDLTSRKLVYDLRIPHHEFVTRLSAISDDGHYVVSVCRELHDTSPNFIIVYDLQSGTLFKKWKPESSSCSIAISSQGGCVVNGLENTWVLVWDLSTGARRFTLRGHSAPADQIRMEEQGKKCLTYDSRGYDRSVRVWDVTKGECLAVFTPDKEFSCCELSLDGKAVIMGLKGFDTITTLLLCRENTVEEEMPKSVCYGDPELKHKEFDMSHDGQ
ncbi:NACHT domain- and WD repeat-containing protein 1 isoform X2 [Parasteatoda tepidariorum]|uniref:NACHT domain- and WD repeat-containing protein 1 isoform X2 n=1 Tax=Parasteatoda tepidariorum TaxID=114398 RepID=UPI00077FC0F7|nr:NACHT domain- and WD repeat-containing protein 1 isoform X2 [Parasteatoda tepidariorum]